MGNDRGASDYILWFDEIDNGNVSRVGGKNASLGEMTGQLASSGVRIPDGFATTAEAYRLFIRSNKLEQPLRKLLVEYKKGDRTLAETGRSIRRAIKNGIFPIPLAEVVKSAYRQLSSAYDAENTDVAVRSSATAEDLPVASFAGLHETYLNIVGEKEVLKSCKKGYASLFTDRAIAYREQKGFDHMDIALSVGIQKMVRADHSCAGVMFTVDTETGFPDVVLINGSWGLGENVVRGTVNPDQFVVFKPLLENTGVAPILEKTLGSKRLKLVYTSTDECRTQNVPTDAVEQKQFVLSDEEVLRLARWAKMIEDHYQRPMDIEWVKEDGTGLLYIVQARPETVHSGSDFEGMIKAYSLENGTSMPIVSGLSIGSAVAHGNVKVVHNVSELENLQPDDILVAQMTEPDWVPAMKDVAGIITEAGGRTCHAAIISRELGIPAVVATGNATRLLKEGQPVTLSCAEGETGKIYDGIIPYTVMEFNPKELPRTKTDILLNLATPESAFKWWWLPTRGVGLARMEFIISDHIKIHPMALIHFDRVMGEAEREQIRKLTRGYPDKIDYFIEKLSRGISKIAAVAYPGPVIVRTSDFKTNEYAGLIGGKYFEPGEENPMLGWRGASRYYSEGYRAGFSLECMAIRRVREELGFDNVILMIPFCRTLGEAGKVVTEMEKNGLKRGENGFKLYMMCEIPSNVILVEQFANYFDGFSIGSNDLTQLILGVDRDSPELSYLYDENDEAVKSVIRDVIQRVHEQGSTIGFCGQAPSDNPEYASFLVESGIDSISVNPDSVAQVIKYMSKAEIAAHNVSEIK